MSNRARACSSVLFPYTSASSLNLVVMMDSFSAASVIRLVDFVVRPQRGGLITMVTDRSIDRSVKSLSLTHSHSRRTTPPPQGRHARPHPRPPTCPHALTCLLTCRRGGAGRRGGARGSRPWLPLACPVIVHMCVCVCVCVHVCVCIWSQLCAGTHAHQPA
jgi:hypothetical protein